jgi:hypothetical protein
MKSRNSWPSGLKEETKRFASGFLVLLSLFASTNVVQSQIAVVVVVSSIGDTELSFTSNGVTAGAH